MGSLVTQSLPIDVLPKLTRPRVVLVTECEGLAPEEVDVELYYGNLKSLEEVTESHVEPMEVREELGDSIFLYGCALKCEVSGRFGFTVRVSPRGDKRIKSTPRLLTWA